MNTLTVGQIEKATQTRVVALFQQRLGYRYLGNWIDRENTSEPAMRHLIDTYIRADDSEKISAFDDLNLVQLIVERRQKVVDYKEYLAKIADLSKQVLQLHGAQTGTPASIKTAAPKALFNNLWQDEGLAFQMDGAIRGSSQDDLKANTLKTKLVRKAIRTVLESALAAKVAEGFTGVQDSGIGYTLEAETTRILELAKNQHDY